jgi:hypothetical protein
MDKGQSISNGLRPYLKIAQQCAQPCSLRSLDTPKLRFVVPVSVKRSAALGTVTMNLEEMR